MITSRAIAKAVLAGTLELGVIGSKSILSRRALKDDIQCRKLAAVAIKSQQLQSKPAVEKTLSDIKPIVIELKKALDHDELEALLLLIGDKILSEGQN